MANRSVKKHNHSNATAGRQLITTSGNDCRGHPDVQIKKNRLHNHCGGTSRFGGGVAHKGG